MLQSSLVNAVGEQLALQVHAHEARQMRRTHLMVKTGPGATVRQLATTLGFSRILIVELANPLAGLLLQLLNPAVALGTCLQRSLRVMRNDEAKFVPVCFPQNLIFGVQALCMC